MGVPRKEKPNKNHETSKPQFFILVSPSLQLHKLKLPKEFVKNHGKHLSNFAYLRVPNGAEWPVEMNKIKDNVWLHRGWNQFAEHYSIARGCLLVFRYEGSSRFRVLIFDKTALEMDYSRHNNLSQSAKKSGEFRVPTVEITEEDDEATEDDTSIEMLDDLLQHQSGVSTIPCDAHDRALERARAFQSPNPSFIVHIRRRNLTSNLGPVIPSGHVKAYFKERNDGNDSIDLRINAKTWCIKYYYPEKRPLFVTLAMGWGEFVSKNDLQEGDILVFELIDMVTKTYNGHLFRNSELMGKSTQVVEEIEDDIHIETSSKKTCIETSRRRGKDKKHTARCSTSNVRGAVVDSIMEKAKAFLADSPGFILRMNKSYVKTQCTAHIPRCHSKIYLKDDGDELNAIVIHGKGGKTWRVKYRDEISYKRVRLSSGWSNFRSDNCLKMDDICVFKLISSTRKEYDITIFRANGK